MDDEAAKRLHEEAEAVLKHNDRGQWTVPHPNLYPHQWLWDSCFISMGLRHLDIGRAQTELRSLLRGQWHNGMLAHLIFSGPSQRLSQRLSEGWANPNAPDNVTTSGFTQPPMLAEAVWQIGQKLKLPGRRSWFKEMLPPLVRHHSWIYEERDTGHGLAMLIHPYESGLDNTPSSISEVYKYAWPWWISLLEKTHLANISNLVRRDLRFVAAKQRMSNAEAIAYFSLAIRLRRQGFNIVDIRKKPRFAVEDLAFNSILIRANEQLRQIARIASWELSEKLISNMERSKKALELLWDETSGQYFSRSSISGQLIKEPTIATLLPLYSGTISKERADHLVDLLKRRRLFSTSWPVPSVPQTSSYFNPVKYWQGPTWINTNWLIVDGLKRSGYKTEAEVLKNRTLKMVAQARFADYFNPLSGQAMGASDFSWTAALTIDLLKA